MATNKGKWQIQTPLKVFRDGSRPNPHSERNIPKTVSAASDTAAARILLFIQSLLKINFFQKHCTIDFYADQWYNNS
jgi:hypothetical protein